MKYIFNIIAPGLLLLCSFVVAQSPLNGERVYPDGYITGQVTSANGPEVGVWVIAETGELNTPFIKIVVTDEQGRSGCRKTF